MMPLVQSRPDPKGDADCEGGGEEVLGEFVVASGDAVNVFEAAEGVLEEATFAVARLVVRNWRLAVAAWRGRRTGSLARAVIWPHMPFPRVITAAPSATSRDPRLLSRGIRAISIA
jgi:hypothetical protein